VRFEKKTHFELLGCFDPKTKKNSSSCKQLVDKNWCTLLLITVLQSPQSVWVFSQFFFLACVAACKKETRPVVEVLQKYVGDCAFG
jgi:hypothetical protein